MECKYCGAALTEGASVCPACGKAQEETEQIETTAAEEIAAEAAEETAEEAAEVTEGAEETAEEAAEVKSCGRSEPCADCEALPDCEQAGQYFADELEQQKQQANAAKREKKKKTATTAVAVVLVLALVASFVAILVPKKPIAEEDVPGVSEDGEAQPTVSYTATAEELTDEVLDRVVAVCGDRTLTNRALGIYYWQQYYVFASSYGSYLPYFLDTTMGLDEQMYDETITWQQQFLDRAVMMFHRMSAIVQQAEAEGFTLPQDDQAYIDDMMQSLPAAAQSYGYDSADAFLQAQFGPGVTTELYRQYAEDSTLAMAYLQSRIDASGYTDADIEAYFDAHAEEYAQNRVVKLDTPNIDIRHILIVPEETDETGNYTEDAWKTAEKTAQDILSQWQEGEATEESFASLAMENSADGSAAAGGLIQNVYPGQMVDEFNDWCFAEGRSPGDVDIVKSQFGYHVMFFSAVGTEIHWRAVAENDYLGELSASIEDEIAAGSDVTLTLENAAIFDVLKAARLAQEAQQNPQDAD